MGGIWSLISITLFIIVALAKGMPIYNKEQPYISSHEYPIKKENTMNWGNEGYQVVLFESLGSTVLNDRSKVHISIRNEIYTFN